MPAANPRVSAVLDREIVTWLQRKAEQDGLSLSMVVREILKKHYEEAEERFWVREGEDRLQSFDASTALSHDDVWD
jgi:predicted DNA-binding protein